MVQDEVKPKFVKGAKRYGRRSRPDSEPDATETSDSTPAPPSPAGTEGGASLSLGGVRQAKLRRSTSLESVEVRSFGLILPGVTNSKHTEEQNLKLGQSLKVNLIFLKGHSPDRKVNLYIWTQKVLLQH